MSNTVITNFRDASGPRSSADSPFVVVLERDGTISLDNAALDGLVSGDASQSSGISVVRVGQEGRPEDATDSETEDESVPHVTLSVDGYYDDPNGIAKYDSGIEMLQSLSNETREHSLIGFQNDHCYTPLMSPSDMLPTDSTSEISYHELQQPPKPLAIPSSKKITILEQQIIPKGKKIVFNPTKTPVILKGNDVLTKPLPGLATKFGKKLTNTTSPQVNEKLEELPDDIAERTESSATSTSGESVNDRDSDSDYKYARDHLSSKSKKNKTVLKGVKKVIAKNFGNIKNISKSVSKSKSTKSLLRQEIKDKILHKKSKLQLEKKANTSNLVKKQPEIPVDATTAPPKEPVKVEPKVETPKPQKLSKKEKKTPAHMTALLSDMTSLFSTPDVIRRVSTDGKQKGEKGTAVPSKDAAPTNPLEVGALADAGMSVDIKDKAVSKQPVPLKTYSKPKEGVNLTEKMVKEMESIPQIDDASLAQLLQDTPVITTGSETATSLGVATTTAANPLSSPNMGPLSPTLDLLAGLQPEEEGLTEDLLMHVAQLVESSENLQEVIDKQVLGKVDPVPSKPTTLAPPTQTALTYSQVSSASKISQRSIGPRKDPIQIIRSDGRIITLPPIEAPATRSSKRKSLGPALQEQEAPVQEIPIPVPETTLLQVNPKQYANKKLSLKKNEAPQTSGEVTKFLQESDDSLNSEDDPYRLWCICKQPHNNRFMICCDRCEDWFHGKCVNITKAMGQQMEEQGVEWTCPNCINKFQTPKTLPKPALTRRSVEGPREVTRASASPATGMVARKASEVGVPSCIVCEKTARAGSIYCSDACILKHAQESLGPNASSPTKADPHDKSDARVIVFERKTGRCLQGPNAPTANNLKAWLQEHPTFEVVRRERENKPMVNVKKTPARPLQKIQTTLKFDKQQKQIILVQPQTKPPQIDTKTSRSIPQSPQEDVPRTPTTPKPNVSTRPTISLKQTLLTSKEAPTTPKSGPPTPRQGPQTPKQGPPMHKQTPPTPRLTSPTPKTPTKVTLVRTPSSTEKQQSTRSVSTPTTRRREREPEPKPKPASTAHIRESVRSALREQLTLRLAETKGVKFTDDEIKKFAINTELELHNLFKEASMKYKAKYRSLIFNIKDRKNLSLWQKICDRSLTPKQLVRMSPEELASQELAQWRDKEAKYQLELIKKSELDLLAANKTYVLKTHKGEEVMETPKPVAAELDPNVAVEDLVTALNDSTAGEEEPSVDKDNKSNHSRHKDQILKKSPPLETRARSSSRHKSQKEEKSKTSHKKGGRDDKERKVEEQRSRRDRHKPRSRDRARDKSQQRAEKKETRSKSVSKETPSSSEQAKTRSRSRERSKHRSRSRERSRTRHRSRSKSKRSQSKYRSQSQERPHRSLSQENDYRSKDKYSKESELVERPKSAMQKEVHPEYDPHEPMITSAFSEEDLRRSREASFEEPYVDEPIELPSEEYNPASTLTLSAASSSRVDRIPSEAESDQEPSSTVDSSAPPVWNGLVNMVDVARFYVDAHEVSGNCTELEEELSPELDIVGRINPKSVWEYIGKMKRAGNKDILVLRLSAAAGATVEERMQYIALYSYLSSRNRLGVVKVTNTSVKDFYIFPLAASAPVPPVLLPLDRGPGLEDTRNHLLVAIIVRQRKKRHATTKPDTIPAKISKSSVRTRSYTPPVGGESYTPPTSPTRRSAALRLPLPFVPPTPALSSSVKDKIAASLASAEDEEPYSPGSSSGSGGSAGGGAAPDALRSRVDEINRQIEEQKQQILSMTATVQPSEDEAYSPSRPMTPPRPALADISLPSNLQEILATIQQRSAAPPPPTDVDMRVPPPPPTGHLHALTEEELLRMVPDNAH